ncbi:ASKHA domain-containing protein [Leisingera sp. S232]|uniref:ASKHA domain-containing protein n=1 Tax=Leisingera sp. S232 TaxID=3415132 RepID=UPI003C7E31C4
MKPTTDQRNADPDAVDVGSKTICVSFQTRDGVAKVTVPKGTSILEAALQAKVDIETTCGKRGTCRSCRIKVLSGRVPPETQQDRQQLGTEELQERFRLSCQTKAIADCTIVPSPPKSEAGLKVLNAEPARDKLRGPISSGVEKHLVHPKPPMDENEETSDLEEVMKTIETGAGAKPKLSVLRKLPGLLRDAKDGLTVTLFNGDIVDLEKGDRTDHAYGMAFDIGTTTIAGSLLNLSNGEQIASVSGVNPQAIHGGDLMSRISFAQFDEKKLAILRGKLLTAMNDFIAEAAEQAGIERGNIYKIVVVGNTCMHHVFLGIDTSHVGLAPYAPAFRDPLIIPSGEVPLKNAPNAHVCTLPIIAGFVGADTIAALLASRIYESDTIQAVVDIGTNGEVVLGNKDRLMACSAPAGPALEGGEISQGMRAAVGAIDAIEIHENDVSVRTIEDAPAIGICGSGLIDIVSKLRDRELVNKRGRLLHKDFEQLPKTLGQRFVQTEKSRGFRLVSGTDSGSGQDIILTQADIRQLQLAKGAIYSAILMLQRVLEVRDEDIDTLYLAGGFGNFINLDSAIKIRLLPPLDHDRISYVGNAAQQGAELALLSESERENTAKIAARIEHVALATRMEFQELFVDACDLQ